MEMKAQHAIRAAAVCVGAGVVVGGAWFVMSRVTPQEVENRLIEVVAPEAPMQRLETSENATAATGEHGAIVIYSPASETSMDAERRRTVMDAARMPQIRGVVRVSRVGAGETQSPAGSAGADPEVLADGDDER
jgi:hypothetical protein